LDTGAGAQDRRQPCVQGQGVDTNPVGLHQCIGNDIKGLSALVEPVEGGRDILRSPDLQYDGFEAQRGNRGLNLSQFLLGGGVANVDHDCQSTATRDDFAQELETLASHIGALQRQAGDVASWSRQAIDEAATDRIDRYRKDDRDDCCRVLYCGDCVSARHDDVYFRSDELRGELDYAFAPSFCPPVFDRDVPPLDPTKLAQPLCKSFDRPC
jgi:hypothetical protein